MLLVGITTGAATLSAQQAAIADRYLERLTQIWQEDATPDDVVALGTLMAEDAVYEHPRVDMRVTGRDRILQSMGRFLGTSRQPTVSNVSVLAAPTALTLSFDVAMQIRGESGWQPIERHQVVILEVRDGLIRKITDSW